MTERERYSYGVLWIAINDEPEEMRPARLQWAVTTMLLADLFDKDPLVVARSIVRKRKKLLKDGELFGAAA